MSWLPDRWQRNAADSGPSFLTQDRASEILARYRDRKVPNLSYATVEDYCDSVDHLPEITGLRGDLKDVQRPWTAKTLISLLPPKGSTLLEFGAGRPDVAALLASCGYKVITFDPYEGGGRGPTDYEEYRREFPQVDIRQGLFDDSTEFKGKADAIYSISTLEHIPDPSAVFRGIRKFLKPGGISLHCVDIVVKGAAEEFHRDVAGRVLEFHGAPQSWDAFVSQAQYDVDTYFLGPSGHQMWRGAVPYREFPFRRVISLQTWARF
jgi:SAM-dependent methyltransferase